MSVSDVLVFMCIPEAVAAESKSFEEVRIDDYIKAYRTTGRPPVPVPQEPADEVARRAMGLLPLFKPQSLPAVPSTSALTPSAVRILNPTQLPVGQEFRLHVVDAEKYQSISCIPEYRFFSPEELRYYAYLAGNKQSPVPIKMDPYTVPDKVAPTPLSNEDRLQTICAQPGYERHSPEEFRIAWLLHGRELTSAELDSLQNPSAAPTLALPAPAPQLSLTLPAPTLPQPVYASSVPSIPKFSFGFK